MTIRVLDIELGRPVGPFFGCRRDVDAQLGQVLIGLVCVRYLKGKMVTTGNPFDLAISPASQAGILIGQRDMDHRLQEPAGLAACLRRRQPDSGKIKIGSVDFLHAEAIAIEPAGLVQVGYDQSDVIDRLKFDR